MHAFDKKACYLSREIKFQLAYIVFIQCTNKMFNVYTTVVKSKSFLFITQEFVYNTYLTLVKFNSLNLKYLSIWLCG